MKLCIPVCEPKGLDSLIQPHLPDAEHLLFYDVDTREYEHVSLCEQDAGAARNIQMDAVLCGSINRMTLRRLIEQGIQVYGIETQTVSQAIAQFENGELQAAVVGAGGGCGGGCGSHGGAHAHAGGGCCSGGSHGEQASGCHGHGHEEAGEHGCGGGGCGGGHEHGHEGGGCCGSHGHEAAPAVEKTLGDVFRIAVCSQNRKTVTEHAGKCRKFWVYEINKGQVVGKTLLELPLEQSFHSTPAGQAHPLDDVDVLITAGVGSGLTQRLTQRGIQCVVTTETNPEQAVAEYLAGSVVASSAVN